MKTYWPWWPWIAGLLTAALLTLSVILLTRAWVTPRFDRPASLEDVMVALEAEAATSQSRTDSVMQVVDLLRSRLERLQRAREERVDFTLRTRGVLQSAIDSLRDYADGQQRLKLQMDSIIYDLTQGRKMLTDTVLVPI